MLGEFEYLLLSAAARLADDAYGAAIRLDIEDSTGRRCSVGALYDLGSPGGQGFNQDLDGRSDAAARRTAQAHGSPHC